LDLEKPAEVFVEIQPSSQISALLTAPRDWARKMRKISKR
jgi:hypothetical protein